MKQIQTIAIGTKPRPGPYGGGNQFANSLTSYLAKQGYKVVHDLSVSNIDAILVTSVKPWATTVAFDPIAAQYYRRRHPATRIILRINECDERKGKRLPLLNNTLRASMHLVDHTVFVSHWLKQTLLESYTPPSPRNSVIRSAANSEIFNPNGRAFWNGHSPLKIITHHWSSNWHKGWDVYQTLDHWLGFSEGRPYRFTFIGNPWPKAKLQHTTIIPPRSGHELSRLLKQHHLYISASLHEPAGMHFIEAMQCGLPVLWRSSGSLPEYCRSFGRAFTGPHDFASALKKMRREYWQWAQAVQHHRYTADDMGQQYLDLFQNISPSPISPALLTANVRLRQGLLWLRDSLA